MEIRPIKKSEWELLLRFNGEEYSPRHILTNKIYYDWQFDNFANPDHDFYSTLGLFGKNGEIMGTFGRFPAPYSAYGKTVMGNCLANLIVKKNLRALGYGYLLLERAGAEGDIAIDHTVNETAWPMFMKAGWEGENLKRYLYIINSKNDLYDVPAAGLATISAGDFGFERIQKFDDTIDAFWERMCGRYPITIARTAQYLNWRYAENPLANYDQFVVKKGLEIKALVVMRVEDVKKDTGPTGIRVGRIVDFVSDDESQTFALFRAVEFCRKEQIDFLDYFESGNFHRKALLETGFVDGDDTPYDLIPLLFNPISIKRTHLNFVVKKKSHFPLKDWYTTKGGGDMDRPY